VCFSRAALALALALLASCKKQESVHRVAIPRFENLSSAAADQDWIGRAISEEIAGQLEGTRHSSVVSSAAIHQVAIFLGGAPERSAAVTAGANRVVAGFYSVRNGRLSLTAVMESVPGGAQKQLFSGSGPVEDLLHLCEQVARQIDEEAAPPITGSLRALRSYALGVGVPPEAATPLFTEAIQLDPDFGPPYVALARLAMNRHDTAAFSSIFQASRARGNGIAAVDRALLNLDDADLHAAPAARLDALAALVRITPADPFHLRELADAELEINRYAEAAEHYRRLAGLLPTEADPLNRMGYALMYSGDEQAAMKAFQDFRRLDHQSANAMDSTGDGHFFFHHFAAAEQDYLAAYKLNPNLQEGTELVKAAWTRLMRKDTTGAIQLVHRYLEDRKNSNDELASYRIALVEELSGHSQLANQLMEPYINSGSSNHGGRTDRRVSVIRRIVDPNGVTAANRAGAHRAPREGLYQRCSGVAKAGRGVKPVGLVDPDRLCAGTGRNRPDAGVAPLCAVCADPGALARRWLRCVLVLMAPECA